MASPSHTAAAKGSISFLAPTSREAAATPASPRAIAGWSQVDARACHSPASVRDPDAIAPATASGANQRQGAPSTCSTARPPIARAAARCSRSVRSPPPAAACVASQNTPSQHDSIAPSEA